MLLLGKNWIRTSLLVFFIIGCYLEVAAGGMEPTVSMPLRILKVLGLGGLPMALVFTGTIYMSRYCLENHREGVALKTVEILALVGLVLLALALLAFFLVSLIVRSVSF